MEAVATPAAAENNFRIFVAISVRTVCEEKAILQLTNMHTFCGALLSFLILVVEYHIVKGPAFRVSSSSYQVIRTLVGSKGVCKSVYLPHEV